MSNDRVKAATEATAFSVLRLKARALVQWIAQTSNFKLYELPLVKTAYIPFGITLAALAWVRLSGETWAEYGLKGMKDRRRLFVASLFLIFTVLAYSILVAPLVDTFVINRFGGSPTQAADTFKDVVGNLPLFLFVQPFIWIFAAFGEEFFYRGFLMTKIARAFGRGRGAWVAAALIQACVFGLAHSYQGPAGVVGTGVAGLIYGFGTLAFNFSDLQNGAPDGIALVGPSNQVVHFISYEGSFDAADGAAEGDTAMNIGVSENPSQAGESLQLTWSAVTDWCGSRKSRQSAARALPPGFG